MISSSSGGLRRRACEAALIPAASPPTTINLSVKSHPTLLDCGPGVSGSTSLDLPPTKSRPREGPSICTTAPRKPARPSGEILSAGDLVRRLGSVKTLGWALDPSTTQLGQLASQTKPAAR